MNIDELKNVSLSEATMRPEDLIPCFIYAIQQIDPDNKPLMGSMHELEVAIQDELYFESEDSQFDLDYLFDTLNNLAPKGYYFGSHPGNGSDYGFWKYEEVE
jgi:hypothetical protein